MSVIKVIVKSDTPCANSRFPERATQCSGGSGIWSDECLAVYSDLNTEYAEHTPSTPSWPL